MEWMTTSYKKNEQYVKYKLKKAGSSHKIRGVDEIRPN
jgi:hypothetical protein